MNLKILFLLLIYYSILSLVFVTGSEILTGYNSTINLNDSELSDDEVDTGGIFSTGLSFTRFLAFVGFGIGLPDSTPSWFSLLFTAWQSIITIFSIGFVMSSIWNG